MRWRARGTDYHDLWAQKCKEKEASLLLPVVELPACRAPRLENNLTSATLLSSFETVVQGQKRGLLHKLGEPQVAEWELAAELLTRTFEKLLLSGGRGTFEEASPHGLVPEKEAGQSGTSAVGSRHRSETLKEDEPESDFWRDFESMERIEVESIFKSPVSNFEEKKFLKDALQQSSLWSGMLQSGRVQVDEDFLRLSELREKVGLDLGTLAEPQKVARVTTPSPPVPCMVSMLEGEEQCRSRPAMKHSLLATDRFSRSMIESTFKDLEFQELDVIHLINSTEANSQKPALCFSLCDIKASHSGTMYPGNLGGCFKEGFKEEEHTWFHFVEKHVLDPEETGLADSVLLWNQILGEKHEAQSSSECQYQSLDLPAEELTEPAVVHPLEFFTGLPLGVAKAVLGSWQKSAGGKAGQLENLLEQPTAESAEDEFHCLVTYPELRMDSFNFNTLPVVYIPSQAVPVAQSTRLFASPAVRFRNLAGDSLYLDWHLSLAGACNQASCFQFKKRVQDELDPAPAPPLPREPSLSGTTVLLDFLACPEPDETDSSEGPHAVKDKEAPAGEVVLQRTGSPVAEAADGITPRSSFVSKTAGAMTKDLSFFMQARRGTVRMRDPATVSEPQVAIKKQKVAPSEEVPQGGGTTNNACVPSPVKHHLITLPEDHEALLAVLQSDYSAIQVNEKAELSGRVPVFGVDPGGNRQLMSMVKAAAASGEGQAGGQQQRLRLYANLWTLRQTAANLVEYGVRVSFLYLEHSLLSMPFMSMAVLKSKTALESAYERVEAGLAIDSPKLHYLQSILTASSPSRGQTEEPETAVLIVADRRAFISMYNELVAAGLRPFQLDRDERILKQVQQGDASGREKVEHAVQEALAVANCLLVSFEYLKGPFTLDRFRTIIHYSTGQLSHSDAEIAQIDVVLAQAACPQHVLRVRSRQEGTPPTGNDGGDPSARRQAAPGGDRVPPQALVTHPPQSAFNEPLDCQPSIKHIPAPQATALVNPQTRNAMPPDRGRRVLIVANMLDSEVSMRRGLYQAVVQLEKHAHAQVVERDMLLAVDFIIHGATCLTIFTPERLGLDALCLDDAPRLAELFPGCFQEVVDSHLKAVSFAYKTAVLIFEGPPAYLRTTFPELTPLHAAALALDLNLQCLLSDGPETTNRCSLNLIHSLRTPPKFRAHWAPPEALVPMPEAATLLEEFLTAFPCLNAVSAHAIMAAGVPLPHFVQMSEEQQLARTRGFDVPMRSLRLFALQFLAHGGTELDHGVTTEAGPDEGGFDGRGVYGMANERGRAQMGSGDHTRTQAAVYQPMQSYQDCPPTSRAQQQHHPSFQTAPMYGADVSSAYDQEYPPDDVSHGHDYFHFPTAAQIAAEEESECEWPSAREIAEQEEQSPPLRERVQSRGQGRRSMPPTDDLETLLPENLYRDLPTLGRTEFDDFSEGSAMDGRPRQRSSEEFGQRRLASTRSGRPPVLSAATRVAAWQDPRDAPKATARGATDAVGQWLGKKRKQPPEHLPQGTPAGRYQKRPCVDASASASASGLFDRAPVLPSAFALLGSSANGLPVSKGRRGAGTRQGRRDSGGSTSDALLEEQTERPAVQEAIAHFRMYVPEASRKGGVENAPQKAQSDGGQSTTRPHLMDVPQDKRANEVLGYKRHGRDKQTRLSWGSTPSSQTSSRQPDRPRTMGKAGSFATF